MTRCLLFFRTSRARWMKNEGAGRVVTLLLVHNRATKSPLPSHTGARRGEISRAPTPAPTRPSLNQTTNIGGCLSYHWRAWEEIGSPPQVVQWIRDGVQITFTRSTPGATRKRRPPPPSAYKTILNTTHEQDWIRWFIEDSQRRGILRRTSAKPTVGAHLRVKDLSRPKPKQYRFITNCRPINWRVPARHFHLFGPTDVVLEIPSGAYAITVDFEDFFFQILVHPESQERLVVELLGQRLAHVGLPMGYSLSPWIAKRVGQALTKFLRSQGVQCLLYVDDLLLWNTDPTILQEQYTNIVQPTLVRLGIRTSVSKSRLEPTQEFQYIGFIFNTVKQVIQYPDDKKRKLVDMIQSARELKTLTAKKLARLAGTIVSSKPALWGAQWCAAQIWRCIGRPERWSALTTLTQSAIQSLRYFESVIMKRNSKPWNSRKARAVYTDASPTGWGAVSERLPTLRGKWTKSEQETSTTIRELRAMTRTFQTKNKSWVQELFASEVRPLLDSTGAISYIRRGTGRYIHLRKEVDQFYKAAMKLRIYLWDPEWIPSELQPADEPSRFIDRHDWSIPTQLVRNLSAQWGITPQMDLFATEITTHYPRYFTWLPQADTMGTDALRYYWRKPFYACPPVPLIPAVARKLAHMDAITGILIIPWADTISHRYIRGRADDEVDLGWADVVARISQQTYPPRGRLHAFLFKG